MNTPTKQENLILWSEALVREWPSLASNLAHAFGGSKKLAWGSMVLSLFAAMPLLFVDSVFTAGLAGAAAASAFVLILVASRSSRSVKIPVSVDVLRGQSKELETWVSVKEITIQEIRELTLKRISYIQSVSKAGLPPIFYLVASGILTALIAFFSDKYREPTQTWAIVLEFWIILGGLAMASYWLFDRRTRTLAHLSRLESLILTSDTAPN